MCFMKTKIIRKILAIIVVASTVMSASGLVSAGKGKKDGNFEKTKPATSSVHEKRKNNDLSDKEKKLKEENENFAKSITQKLTPGKKYSKEEMVDIFNKLLTFCHNNYIYHMFSRVLLYLVLIIA